MAGWAADELARLGGAEEIRLASLRGDGGLRKPVTIWVVPHEDNLYVRSVRGPEGTWFRGTRERNEGRISAGAVQKDVTFLDIDHAIDDEIDAAYRAKYRRYAGRILDSVLTAGARATTIKLVPRTGDAHHR